MTCVRLLVTSCSVGVVGSGEERRTHDHRVVCHCDGVFPDPGTPDDGPYCREV